MRIKVAIIESDETYLAKLSKALMGKYSTRLQVSCFSDAELALKACSESRYDLILLNESLDSSKFVSAPIIYLVEEIGVTSYKNCKAISKYQKISSIYSQIIEGFSEATNDRVFSNEFRNENSLTRVITFMSFSGGVGVTSVSVAACEYLASQGYNVMYLNMGLFTNPGLFFSNDGEQNFTNVIYAVKSKKSNLELKIESAFSYSFSGVAYFAKPNMSIDVSEMKEEDWLRLIELLKHNFSFDYVVIDYDSGFDFSSKTISVFDRSDKIVIVNDGSFISNSKFEMAYQSLFILEEEKKKNIIEKMLLLYNKFSNKTSLELSNIDIKCIGGINRLDRASANNSVKFIKEFGDIFAKLI